MSDRICIRAPAVRANARGREEWWYLNASHNSSTHDTQFETMISPVRGLQPSSV